MYIKKILFFFVLLFIFARPVVAQKINIDSIVKVVAARSPHQVNALTVNKDSLFKRLDFTHPGAERIKLIIDLQTYVIYPDNKQSIDMAYRVLTWSKAHHDLAAEAVIATLQAWAVASNGDKTTAMQLQNEAMAAAIASHDKTALSFVYNNESYFVIPNLSVRQSMANMVKAIKYGLAAGDAMAVSWGYGSLSSEYAGLRKLDSAKFFAMKTFEWTIRSGKVADICSAMDRIGYSTKDKRLRLTCFNGALTLAKLTGDIASIPSAAISIADYYIGENKLDSALFYTYKAYIIEKHLTLDDQRHTVNILGDIYTQKRNIDSAVKYIRLYYTICQKVDNNESIIRAQAMDFDQKQKQQKANAEKTALKNAQQRWVLAIVIVFLLFIAFIFWRNYRLSKKANTLLARQKQQTELALSELKSTQQQLVQSEKMASLGELTAGIAHEIQNPLNFVNNFSEVSAELIGELDEELDKGDIEAAKAIATDVKQNLEKIHHHGKRADGIVKGMLEHSRASTGQKEPTDINKLVDEYLRLAYHGLRAKDKSFNAELVTNFAEGLPEVNIVPQDIGRVLLNILNNAFYATHQKQQAADESYKPEVAVTTLRANNHLSIIIRDNGSGIPDAIKEKIMQPFFTTKPTGEGTGLGLSLSYDIVVKGHIGTINIDSKEGEYSTFTVSIPVNS